METIIGETQIERTLISWRYDALPSLLSVDDQKKQLNARCLGETVSIERTQSISSLETFINNALKSSTKCVAVNHNWFLMNE